MYSLSRPSHAETRLAKTIPQTKAQELKASTSRSQGKTENERNQSIGSDLAVSSNSPEFDGTIDSKIAGNKDIHEIGERKDDLVKGARKKVDSSKNDSEDKKSDRAENSERTEVERKESGGEGQESDYQDEDSDGPQAFGYNEMLSADTRSRDR